MAEIRRRLLVLVVAVTAAAGLFVGWVGGIAGTGALGLSGTVGFVVGLGLLLAILLATWFVLEERRPAG